MANLIKRGDIYYAEVRIPNDVKSIFSKSVFRRSTGCKDRRNAELEAAPWISSWWKEIKEARTNIRSWHCYTLEAVLKNAGFVSHG